MFKAAFNEPADENLIVVFILPHEVPDQTV